MATAAGRQIRRWGGMLLIVLYLAFLGVASAHILGWVQLTGVVGTIWPVVSTGLIAVAILGFL